MGTPLGKGVTRSTVVVIGVASFWSAVVPGSPRKFVPSVPVMQALLRDYGFDIRRELKINEERYACLLARP